MEGSINPIEMNPETMGWVLVNWNDLINVGVHQEWSDCQEPPRDEIGNEGFDDGIFLFYLEGLNTKFVGITISFSCIMKILNDFMNFIFNFLHFQIIIEVFFFRVQMKYIRLKNIDKFNN